ncbi:hypothetical protein GWN42_24750 [candidate division KSB1 bacterium]|nr:hypothetical protein [candidate division KSB1 bacterium]NIS23671.1 hypothetical protein [candidate division KSB1 bacterium]NIU24313.1 hypothetical protein [candidate division KSB1 bacterium]NIU93921.1 hypothetical protein [candidate division KSB1 bacterium]NIV95912.1 hypothetical protein [candidate division KSB1 bacterium]
MLDYIDEKLRAFELQPTRFGDAGISVDVMGRMSGPEMTSLRVENNTPLNVSGLKVPQAVVGLAVAKVLWGFRDEIKDGVRLIFQSRDHEAFDNARLLIKKGLLEDVSVLYGVASTSLVSEQKVGINFGSLFPSSKRFSLSIFGGNGRIPAQRTLVNNIQIAADVVLTLKQAINRRTDPLKPVVIAISSIHSEDDRRSTQGKVTLEGSFSTHDDSELERVRNVIRDVVKSITYHAEFQLDIKNESPILLSNREATKSLQHAAEKFFGREHVVTLEFPESNLGSFREYVKSVPASVLHLGHSSSHSLSPDLGYELLAKSVKTLAWTLTQNAHT